MKIADNIKRITIISFSFLAILYLSGCVTAKQKMLDDGMKPLAATELQSLFAEKRTAKFKSSKKGTTGIVTYLPDGSQSAVSNGKTYTGTYSIENNKYCSKMDHRKGKIKCTNWFNVGDTYQLYNADDGTMDATITFQ